MKNKILEEAAKSEAFEFKVDYKPFETDLNYKEYAEYGFEKGFIAGAEYQAERMYSEEDLRKAIQLARLCTLDGDTGDFVDLTGLTEICTYGLKETHSEDLIIEQCKRK